MILTFDLETLPTADAAVIADIHAKVSPPKTLKKAESIATWWKEEGEEAKAEAVAKTSFDPMTGRIACICYAMDGLDSVYTVDFDDEKLLLQRFFAELVAISKVPGQTPITFCGHNIAGFDLPFLKGRAIIHGIKPPDFLWKAMQAKPWDSCIADTMLMWSSDSQKRASMDKLCKAFGIPGKGDFDGSMVVSTWPVDRQKVIDYCCDDVRRTKALYNRLTFQGAV
jgi:3'-5' exonuclease